MTSLLAVTGLTGLDEWLAESVATGTFTNRSQLDCLCDQHIPKTRLAEHRATARSSTAAHPADMGALVDLVAKSTEAIFGQLAARSSTTRREGAPLSRWLGGHLGVGPHYPGTH
jgi:hypothetical protein